MRVQERAGQYRANCSQSKTYRLDVHYYSKTKPDLFDLWKNVLQDNGISLNIQLLDCVLNVLTERDREMYIGTLEPIHAGPSIWIKPKTSGDLQHNHGIRAIKWDPLMGFSASNCWYNEDVACGNVCKHTDYLPNGAVVYVKRHEMIPLQRLQKLWEICYLGQKENTEHERTGIWINGSQVQPHVQNVPGVHHSQRYAATWTTSESVLMYHPTHWWLQRNMQDVIHWYQGILHKSPIQQDNLAKFSRLSRRIERHFKRKFKEWCEEQRITPQIFWDRKHLREFQKRPETVTPYIQLTGQQKVKYQEILARNRQAMASNQRASEIHSNLPRSTLITD
eukprot:gb/GECG01009652.1/.p1 GENE.gb/GECG01009652.1/~~gb/GECG01009652.1/.p1  ORF type:complete len:336 (+),score=25.32 gb/GECG01009652.1/:1-1008(+)